MNDPSMPPIKQAGQRLKQPWEDPVAPPFIRIEGLGKRFGDFTAVEGVDLQIYRGELFAILGGSGCGKTTLLRMLAGFETPSTGRIIIDGTDMTGVPPYRRPVNMMFQSYAVFPHMTVEENVAYGLRKEGLPRDEIRRRVAEMLDLVKLGGFGQRRPQQLSGGQQQRVALARALVKRPKLLLLDEPLAALDKKLREHTQFELMNIQDALGVTFVVVTHDQEEAMTLASRIAVMDQGRFVQIGTPTEVYEFPCNRFVAEFFGAINVFTGTVEAVSGGEVRVDCAGDGFVIRCRCSDLPVPGRRISVAVRPEKIAIGREAPADGTANVVRGMVWDLAYYGNRSLYQVRLPNGRVIQVSAQNRVRSAQRLAEWDDEVYLAWDSQSCVLLPE